MPEANEQGSQKDDPRIPTVVVTFRARSDLREAILAGLAGAASVVLLQDVPAADRAAAVRAADALLSWNVPRELSPEELAQLHEGQLVQLLSAGANQVPFADVPDWVAVASNVGAYAEPMAEHVLAMALALVKQLPQRHAAMARGEFPQRPPTRSVDGLVCGILGYGGIGKAVAALLRPLGVRIRAINTTGQTDDDVEFIGMVADLDEVLDAADVVVVALPLTNATRGLIGRRELEVMKPDAVLINVARGPIVQEQALYEHLVRYPGFAAGIDAWWVEPFGQGEFRTDFAFFQLPNVLGSPHNSALVPGIEAVAARRAAENVARHLRGQPIGGIVRREDYQAE
jgi:phosphoglycerate dehydrogenase-like enzyme